MEPTYTNDGNFDPTPTLKSSPVLILFLSFKEDEETCNFCGSEYSRTLIFEQRYCKNCLYWYRKYINDNTNNIAGKLTGRITGRATSRITGRTTSKITGRTTGKITEKTTTIRSNSEKSTEKATVYKSYRPADRIIPYKPPVPYKPPDKIASYKGVDKIMTYKDKSTYKTTDKLLADKIAERIAKATSRPTKEIKAAIDEINKTTCTTNVTASTVNNTINNTTNGTANGTINNTMNNTMNATINGIINATTNGPTNGPVNGPINVPINGPINKGPTNGPTNFPINGPISPIGPINGTIITIDPDDYMINYDTSYLDVHISTKNIQCPVHRRRDQDFYSQYIQEWCEYCSDISYFTQVVPYFYLRERIDTQADCKLCGKFLYQGVQNNVEFRLCSDCYKVSSGWIESTLTKKSIPILYFPWWDYVKICRLCRRNLKYITDCQKWCSYCYIVITGCRYCLTTNMIFGITDRSQCRKCKRILLLNIDISNFSSGNNDVDDFLNSTININYLQIACYMKNIDQNNNPLHVYSFNIDDFRTSSLPKMRWIPYSQITNLRKITGGGFGGIYKATWLSDDFFGYEHTVAVKKFINSNISKYFLKELNSLYQCYDPTCVIRCYGITQDPTTKEYMLIMDYAEEGHLRNYLQKNFVTWDKKA